MTRDVPRVAASSYLNSAPVIWSFMRGAQRDQVRLLTDAAPARCADLLARGEAEVALVPVIEYQQLPDLLVVPNVCIGARRAVRSVVLATRRRDLREVRTVALDESSRTSAALVRIIFREFFGQEIETSPCRPDLKAMLAAHDAALIIGDPAMTFSREHLRVYDLASLWRELTGHGFVFAMWMVRAGGTDAARGIDFAAARDEGLRHVEEIISRYELELGLPRHELRSYLRENLCYELNDEMLSGLTLYFQLAHKHGLTERARALRFLGQP